MDNSIFPATDPRAFIHYGAASRVRLPFRIMPTIPDSVAIPHGVSEWRNTPEYRAQLAQYQAVLILVSAYMEGGSCTILENAINSLLGTRTARSILRRRIDPKVEAAKRVYHSLPVSSRGTYAELH